MTAPLSSRNQLDGVLPELYDQLREIASRALRHERVGHTLQTTALVHEAYLRLAKQSEVAWSSRRAILAAAASAMRRILVDHARRRAARKRGGNVVVVSLDEIPGSQPAVAAVDLLALDEALTRLAIQDSQQARVVELRYFASLALEEIAQELDVSLATVKREWAMAKAWLLRELCREARGYREANIPIDQRSTGDAAES